MINYAIIVVFFIIMYNLFEYNSFRLRNNDINCIIILFNFLHILKIKLIISNVYFF